MLLLRAKACQSQSDGELRVVSVTAMFSEEVWAGGGGLLMVWAMLVLSMFAHTLIATCRKAYNDGSCQGIISFPDGV